MNKGNRPFKSEGLLGKNKQIDHEMVITLAYVIMLMVTSLVKTWPYYLRRPWLGPRLNALDTNSLNFGFKLTNARVLGYIPPKMSRVSAVINKRWYNRD